MGAEIRACPLEDFAPYRELKPLIRKQFPLPGPGTRGMYRVEITDPEHSDYVPLPEEPKRRVLAR